MGPDSGGLRRWPQAHHRSLRHRRQSRKTDPHPGFDRLGQNPSHHPPVLAQRLRPRPAQHRRRNRHGRDPSRIGASHQSPHRHDLHNHGGRLRHRPAAFPRGHCRRGPATQNPHPRRCRSRKPHHSQCPLAKGCHGRGLQRRQSPVRAPVRRLSAGRQSLAPVGLAIQFAAPRAGPRQ